MDIGNLLFESNDVKYNSKDIKNLDINTIFKMENDLLEELEGLRDKKQKLQEQAKTISETEKLIDAKENQGPNLDE